MLFTLDALLAELKRRRLYVYPHSADESEGVLCAMVRKDRKKLLAIAGNTGAFTGDAQGGITLCPLTVENSQALHSVFPYTKPRSHAGHAFTIGLGDRLGLATPGHVRAISGYDVYPVLAQQSIRELTLTKRTFADVIASAAFGVFQEGYRAGYGADGDHLKTREEITYALSSGCTMITLDCSEYIDAGAALLPPAEIDAAYNSLPKEIRNHYEEVYLNRELAVIGSLSPQELKRIVLVFYRAVIHVRSCYAHINKIKASHVDFEMSIDETRTITSPAEHYVIANELASAGVRPASLAPHFSGEFEKGIEYSGNLDHFARDFVNHKRIADHFGYKLSVHSGSDKFSVFSTVGRVTGCNVHVKTAGTNWLEAMRVVAKHSPSLYRRAQKFAIERRAEAENYYHVSTDPQEIPDIDLQNDAYLPEYLNLPSSRQTMHITYGLLLKEKWFADEFFPFMADHEEEYYDGLASHIGRHLNYLTGKR